MASRFDSAVSWMAIMGLSTSRLWRILLIAALGASWGCAAQPPPLPTPIILLPTATPTLLPTPGPTLTKPPPSPPLVLASPTPDPVRPNIPDLSALGAGWAWVTYAIQPGEDLGTVALKFGLSLDAVRIANPTVASESMYPGQVVIVPRQYRRLGPAFKIIPDSELVNGPGAADFDIEAFVQAQGGYLSKYAEPIDGAPTSGAALVQRAAENYSLNPRLLLALLEYQSGWVTRSKPEARTYPFGRAEGGTEGLFRQLQWAGVALNTGFYGWRDGSLSFLILGDGARLGMSPGLNAGTAAVQYYFSLTLPGSESWDAAVGQDGLIQTYERLFGDPFARAVEPLLPADLIQPPLALPWAPNETWYFTGGPHASFRAGSPWGGIDFRPPDDNVGCYVSTHWVTAAAPGLIVRSDEGAVIQDLDADGREGTGWVLIYLHLAAEGRVLAGSFVGAGEPLGRPSCEGNATGAHVHIARKYNGAWLAADGPPPFALGKYAVQSTGREYEGRLVYGQFYKVACDCRHDGNAVTNAEAVP